MRPRFIGKLLKNVKPRKLSKSDLKIKIGKQSKFEVKSLQLMSCNIFLIKNII